MIFIMSSRLEQHLRNLRAQRQVFEPGQYLFHLGDPVRVMHRVLSGIVQLVRNQRDGSVLVLQSARGGSIVAEASFCSEHYHCDAVAVGETRTLAFIASEFRAHMRSTPEFAEVWAMHLAHELQTARLQAEILSLKTVAQRLDAWIAWHGGVLPRKGAWRTIANEIGTSPEALYREIARRRPASKGQQPEHGVARVGIPGPSHDDASRISDQSGPAAECFRPKQTQQISRNSTTGTPTTGRAIRADVRQSGATARLVK